MRTPTRKNVRLWLTIMPFVTAILAFGGGAAVQLERFETAQAAIERPLIATDARPAAATIVAAIEDQTGSLR